MDDRPNPHASVPSPQGGEVPPGDAAAALHPQPPKQTLETAARPPTRRRRPGRPWGFWATAGWTILLLVVWYWLRYVLSAVVRVGLVFVDPAGPYVGSTLPEDVFGVLNVAALTVMTVVLVGLIVLLASARRMAVRDYLALTRPAPKETFGWLMAILAMIVVMDVAYRLAGWNPVTDYDVALYTSTPSVLLLFLMVIVAPVLEETWWRGFVYRGIAASKAGPVAAVILTAIPFTLMHTQYNWTHKAPIFAVGLVLATVRWRSGSTVLAMCCHAAINVFYFASTATEVHWLGRTVSP